MFLHSCRKICEENGFHSHVKKEKKTFPHLSPIIVAEQVKEINLLARYGGPQCSQILSEVAFEYLFKASKKLNSVPTKGQTNSK